MAKTEERRLGGRQLLYQQHKHPLCLEFAEERVYCKEKEHNIDRRKHVTRANIQKSTREQRFDGI